MNTKQIARSLLPIMCGLALFEVSGAAHAGPFQSLTSVKFQTISHNVGGTDITSATANRKQLTTQLPGSLSSDLKVYFTHNFSGPTSKPGMSNINALSQQSMIQCYPHVQNHKFASKNKMGFCKAKYAYLNNLTQETTVQLRINSPGGGGNKNLFWKFVPPAPPSPDNGIDRIEAPISITKGNTLSAQIILRYPAESQQTIKWAVYPKGCFKFAGRRRPVQSDNSNLIGSVTYQPNEIQRTFDVLTQACSASSGVIKGWYADPGETANTNFNPDITKAISLKTPRR